MNNPIAILKSGKDQSVKRYHPWVFSGAIKKIKGAISEGGVIDVYDNKDNYLATGHYQEGSIAIRIFTFEQQNIDENFWANQIKKAYNYRLKMGVVNNLETNIYRLIHAEGDNMPGLIADYYNGHIVLQSHSIGMHLLKPIICETLKKIFGQELKSIYDKSSETLPQRENLTVENEYLYKHVEPDFIAVENNIQFKIDWEAGQKTGFFIDQRCNRQLLGQYAKDKTILNTFCYTGGFSLYGLKGGAKKVVSVDSSKRAIDITNENVTLNFSNTNFSHTSYQADVFNFLNNENENFDIIILDPPAFAKHYNVVSNAVQGYKKLNRQAIKIIKSGGILFTFSCSQVITSDIFRKTIFTAAANTGRKVKILHQLSQPIDHPVNIYHPESEYLKGLVLYVE